MNNRLIKILFDIVKKEQKLNPDEIDVACRAIEGIKKLQQQEINCYKEIQAIKSDLKEELIETSINLDVTDDEQHSALHYACLNKHTEIALKLIDEKAKLDAFTIKGMTPLVLSSINGNLAIVNKLIEAGISLDANEQGFSALEWACFHGQKNIVVRLIDANVDFHKTNKSNLTPFDIAMERCYWDVACELLKNNAEIRNLEVFRAKLMKSHEDDNDPNKCYCLGKLYKKEIEDKAKKIKDCFTNASVTIPNSYYQLGDWNETIGNVEEANRLYGLGTKSGDVDALSRLMEIAEELSNPKKQDEKSIVDQKKVTKIIYSSLESHNLNSFKDIISESWGFLAVDAIGNPYFNTIEAQQFAMRAALKMKEEAEMEEADKKEAAKEIFASTFRLFNRSLSFVSKDTPTIAARIIGAYIEDQENATAAVNLMFPRKLINSDANNKRGIKRKCHDKKDFKRSSSLPY